MIPRIIVRLRNRQSGEILWAGRVPTIGNPLPVRFELGGLESAGLAYLLQMGQSIEIEVFAQGAELCFAHVPPSVMQLVGNGSWECPDCGDIIADGGHLTPDEAIVKAELLQKEYDRRHPQS